jgi:hypothetical protein
MLLTTIQELLQGVVGEKIRDYQIYLIYDNGVALYVGQSKDIVDRLYQHIYYSRLRGKKGEPKSLLGYRIIQNLPNSLNWNVKLLTLTDCEPFVTRYGSWTIATIFYGHAEALRINAQYILDNLSKLCPDPSLEMQQVLDNLPKVCPGTLKESVDILTALNPITAISFRNFEEQIDEIFPRTKLLQMYYDPDYIKQATKLAEVTLINSLRPRFNKRHVA